MSAFLKLDKHEGVATVTMDRPDLRNALSSQSDCDEFVSVCHRLERDLSVGAVILTGAGASFCAGGDLKAMKSRDAIGPSTTPIKTQINYRRSIQTIPLSLYNLPVPTIAAVNGAAIGAGLDLACMCDIRLCSEKAKFAESFVKIGLVAGDGGAWLLQEIVGVSKACEMSFTGDMISAEEALQSGLVSKICPPDDLLGKAQELAARIAANPRNAVRLTKRLIREARHARLETLLEMSAAYQAIMHTTEDHHEAVDAFLEKRLPRFKND